MLETSSLMCEKDSEIQFVIALASTRKNEEVDKAIIDAKGKGIKLPKTLITVKNETREALNAADVAAVTSGTATLETAIIGTPFAIVYKASNLNAALIRPLVNIEHFGLVNLIAEKRIVKEMIQEDFTKEDLANELFRLLDEKENKKMREKLSEITEKLGDGGSSKRAAKAVLNELKKDSTKA
jgi:lipid-A-disaccharide synthase